MSQRIHSWFTICSANYLAYAKTLFHSLQDADREAAENFTVVLVDEIKDETTIDSLPFEVILAKDLGIPEFWDMALRYSVMELNTAVKPAAILHLMEQGYSRVTYLDPDIYVTRKLTHVCDAHDAGAQVVLTPHSMQPLEDGFDPDDVRLLRTGVYNLGFVSFANRPAARALLEWWHRRMLTDCRVDLDNGLFVDQKFMDLAPAYGEDVHILRHPGYNVAYWNLASREVKHSKGTWKVGRHSLHFFHFSGVVPGDPTVFSKHQDRFGVDDIGQLKSLLEEYLSQIAANGHSTYRAVPYAYGYYVTGAPIPDIARRVYGAATPSAALSRQEAFEPNFAVLDEPADDVPQGRLPITRAMSHIWKERKDLARSFHLVDEVGREAFCRWFLSAAEREYNLPPEAYGSVRDALRQRDASGQEAGGSFLSPRRLARGLLGQNGGLRSLFRKLPPDVRMFVREFVVRTAAGHGARGAQLTSMNEFDTNLRSGVGLYGYLRAVSGVGEGARRMADLLAAADIDASLHPIRAYGHASQAVPVEASSMAQPSPFNSLLFHINADQTPTELDQLPADWLRGRYRIGYWAWELSEFPNAWLPALDYVHEVWVPSQFVKKAVQAKTDKPVNVVPHPIPQRRDSGENRVSFGLPCDRFLFLCSFDLKSYVGRKNPVAAYDAFCRAFPDKHDEASPRLVVKLHSGVEDTEADRDIVRRIALDPRVILIDVPLSNERYAALQRLCDAYVSLHRSEGFGMNIAECMQLGKPVIATNYSGNTQYFTEAYGFPVDYSLIPVGPGEYPFGEGQVWAEPDLDHAAQLMKHVVADPQDARARGESASAYLSREYSISAIARTVHEHMQRIQRANFEQVAESVPVFSK